MGYVRDFKTIIANHDYSAFLKLWEEYCSGDELDVEEVCEILRAVKSSELAEPFGRHVDRILHLWKTVTDPDAAHEILKLIIDIQTSNQQHLFDLTVEDLKTRYHDDKNFNEKIRLIGLRNKDNFQGAISHFELLSHMEKGNFVFHTGGWGVGEILDVSLVREQLSLEFDYLPGKKEISFATAFKSLVPIPKDHFLALRFGNPDALEKKAKENPMEIIKMLLRDLGPKTAADIKEELCDLVIPASDWPRWWQNARAKIKKDTMIETPTEIREPFYLRKTEVTHEEQLQKILDKKPDPNTLIQTVYSFLRDFPEISKNKAFKETLLNKLNQILSFEELDEAQKLQIHFFLQDLNHLKEYAEISDRVKKFEAIEEILNKIEVLSYKKRFLMEVRKYRSEWKELFLSLLFKLDQIPLRDYILSELLAQKMDQELKKKLDRLATHPSAHPETFLWYFQKIQTNEGIPCSDKEGKILFFEGLLILLSQIENDPTQKEMIKKIYSLLSSGRYAIVRQMMKLASKEQVEEFLLLGSKCHSLSDHDQKIFSSLAEVAHPVLGLARKTKGEPIKDDVIWTTAEGYQKLQQRMQQIATVETVENAKEIEVARSHGDLRENAEFKAALERRDRLQSELKLLSEQLNKARILTTEDIVTTEVDVGAIVHCKNKKGEKISYTLLGPWDADPERNILSFQSKLAQSMRGKEINDTFTFQGEEYTIIGIERFL